MMALTQEQRQSELLRLRDSVIADCRGRGESESLDHRLRLAATLEHCAANLGGTSSLRESAQPREALQ